MKLYEFENFRLDAAKRLLFLEGGETVPLMPKAFEILLHLVENAGKVIEKDELMTSIWPDTVVEENNLTQNISALRRILGEKHRENRFIATVPGRGYKFVAAVRTLEAVESPTDSFSMRSAAHGVEERDLRNTGRPQRTGLWVPALAAIVVIGVLAAGIWFWQRNTTLNGPIRTLAVLPFKPLVAANRDESMELGMADTLISKLNIGEITVRPLNAVRRFGSIDQDPVSAGRELGVEAVLDGSIQMADDRVRVSAALIRVSDGKQLWSDQFNERSSDIFALQDSISEKVAAALQTTLGRRPRKNDTENLEAYQFYTKGKFHSARLILPEVQKAIGYFERAIEADPAYALPYVELANAYRALVLTNDMPPGEMMPKAKAAAERAVALDETSAEAHSALAGTSFWNDWDWQASEAHFRRALELDSNSAATHFGYAHMLSNLGRHDEAIAEIQRAQAIDPVNLVINAANGQILFFAGKDEEALKALNSTIEMEPNFWLAHLFATRVYLKRGLWDEAIKAAERAREITRGNAEATATIGYTHAKAGRRDKAQEILRGLEAQAQTRYVASYAPAQIYAALGENEKAIDLLEKAYDDKDALMVFLKVEPKWDNLRSHPRFMALMKKMKFE